MKKLFKKALAAVLTGAMVIGAMTFTAYADDPIYIADDTAKNAVTIDTEFAATTEVEFTVSGIKEAVKATMGIASADWNFQDWENFTADVTGDGTYKITATECSGNAGVFVIDMPVATEGFDVTATDYKVSDVKVNGEAVSFVYGDIENKGNLRIEIFNQYGPTATCFAEPVAPAPAPGIGTGTAKLNINKPDWQPIEGAEYVTADIDADGTYTVSMTATTPFNFGPFNAIDVENGEGLLGTACILTVDSIKIDGTEIEMAGKSYTCSADCGGVTTRVNLYNEYNTPDATAVAGLDYHKDCRSTADLADTTAKLIPAEYVSDDVTVSSVEVTFTVSNYGIAAEAGEAPEVVLPDPAKDPITTFPAEVGYANAPSFTPDALYTVQTDTVYVVVKIQYAPGFADGSEIWNDYCASGLVVTNTDGSQKVYAFGGKEVGWDISVTAPDAGDVAGGANNADGQWLQLDDTGCGEFRLLVDGKGATVGVYALGWDSHPGETQFTIDIVDGGTENGSTDTTTAAATDNTDKGDTTDKTESGNSFFPLPGAPIIGGCVLVCAAVVCIVLVNKKKKN